MALLHAELTATCNALGYTGAEKYFIDPQCKEAVRDLIKFLRRDGDDHEIRRFLGSANIVQSDLIPILIEYSNKIELFDLIVRLLVNLTTPALLLYNEQPPVEKIPSQYYLQMILHLQKYKKAFTDVKVWKVIVDKLAEVMQAEYHEKGEEKVLSTVRILILIRNILHVPADNDAECRPDNDASLHDQVLWAMHQSQIIDVIMYIACSENEQQYYLHALEIISLMLRDQNAAELANASVSRTETEKERDEQELIAVLRKERLEKMEKLKKYSGSRHSRFGGRYVVAGMKSIGDNEMVVSSMSSNVNKAFDRNKKPMKTPRNRMPLKESGIERKSAFSVRLFLKEFCVEFLHGSYNTLMKHVREILVRSKGQPNDESYYFWAMQFFMEFNRYYKFEIKLISETMALHIFHFVQERIDESREKLLTDKKKIPVWSKRMHLGLKAYKELMETLLVMYQSKEAVLESSARTILTNLFYVVEYRDMILGLFQFYDEVKFSRLYLKDLVETNHVFMKLLENLKNKQRNLIVQRKVKKTNKKIVKTVKSQATLNNDIEDITWDNIFPTLKKIMQTNNLIVDAVEARPYDPVSVIPMEDQKIEAMRRIRMHMRNNRLEESIKLLRASREVWPENGYFGALQLNVDEELDILKQIYFADLGMPEGYNDEIESNNQNDDEDKEETDEEDEDETRIEEENFEFSDFIKKFARPKVLHSCCQLLKDFERNSSYTNHALVKLLHRISYDCKYEALMYQASIFRIFQKIFMSSNPNHKELRHFAIYIIRKFTEVARKNKKVFMELLFWKDLKIAYEIEEGYNAEQNIKKSTNWTEEQEDELHRLHEEYIRDTPNNEDEVTWICKNMIRQDRSRISVLKKLRQLNIVTKKLKPSREFSEAEIVQITQLVYEFKEAADPIGHIINKLEVKRSKKIIINKILELGLVRDRKELRKKRGKTSNKSHGANINNSSDESNESDDEDNYDDQPVYHSLTSSFVINALKKVVDNGMESALQWLIESLDEAAEDLGVDESDVPLLPLTNECMTAINDLTFQNAMVAIGIHKPSGIQETYWRIPGRWQANDIRQRLVTIKKVLEGNIAVDEANDLESSDEDVEATFDRIRKVMAPKEDINKENLNSNSLTNSERKNNHLLSNGIKDNTDLIVTKTKTKKNVLVDTSDSDDNVKLLNNRNKSKRKISINSSDSNEDFVTVNKSEQFEDSNKDDVNIIAKQPSSSNTLKKNTKMLIHSSDSEENSLNVKKTGSLEDSDDDNVNLTTKKSQLVFIKKKKNKINSSTDSSESEDLEFTKKMYSKVQNKSGYLENDSSDKETLTLNKNNVLLDENDLGNSKRKIPLDDSDVEEEIGLSKKKNKYFIDEDSD
ncbi:protein timeless homolog [Daktulosphaira vitifoliae]|uniref:protein timeless homolog n=1 Tax=Daktulosphaira vitifoliae TaxID=58002 RepID=UPI0021AAD02F|nr:protein timeless homolog [Daktulosphaira vitifoliae]